MVSHTDDNSGPWILGINASHNGSACLLKGSRIVAAIQEERLTRGKRERVYGARPCLSVPYCLSAAGIGIGDLDCIAITVQGDAHAADQDIRLNPQLCARSANMRTPALRVYPHHLSHAASVFGSSGFSEAAILIIDGLGSPVSDLSSAERECILDHAEDGWETISLYKGSGRVISPIEKHLAPGGRWLVRHPPGMSQFGSLGGMYAAVTGQIFGDPLEAGKLMGLASLGEPCFAVGDFFQLLPNGTFHFSDKIPALFPRRTRWPECAAQSADLAASVQQALEFAICELVDRLFRYTGASHLCYAGGVALNGKANERILRKSPFGHTYILPAADDSGTALGAANLALWELTAKHQPIRLERDALGRSYTPEEIGHALTEIPYITARRDSHYLDEAVERLCAGQLVGWFQGGSEFGPRALGQRSILCDPRLPDAKEKLNGLVKCRESFRPFAPAILASRAAEWFELEGVETGSPFMLRVVGFRPALAQLVPAVVHADGTGRLQTVSPVNGPFYRLIEKFHLRTGIPLLLNTSFNLKDEPIVETPEEAVWTLVASALDVCILEDFIVERTKDLTAVLDLVPELGFTSYTAEIRTCGGQLDLASLTDRAGKVTGVSVWGPYEVRVPGRYFPILTHIDGVRTGLQILDPLEVEGTGQGAGPDIRQWLAASLVHLKKLRIIRLKNG